jgi:hypothetical protein
MDSLCHMPYLCLQLRLAGTEMRSTAQGVRVRFKHESITFVQG